MPARVLIVDDEADFRAKLAQGLALRGYDVLQAATAIEGLEVVKSQAPDLVLLDVMMDNVDGFEFCRRLRAAPERRMAGLPVLMLTHHHDQVRGFEHGADDYLVKPFDPPVLYARMEALLRRQAVPPPFQQQEGARVLGLTLGPDRPVHLTIGRAMEFVGVTRGSLDLDAARWGELVRNLDPADWRVRAKDDGARLAQELARLPEVRGRYERELGALGDKRKLRLRFSGPREFLRVPLEFMLGVDSPRPLVLDHPVARSVIDLPRNTLPLGPELLDRIWAERRPLRVLGIASNVSVRGEIPAIPGAEAEVESLRELPELFGKRGLAVVVDVLPTAQATYDNARQKLEQCSYDVVHYAGHAFYDDGNPQGSGLVFWKRAAASGGVAIMSSAELSLLLERSQVGFMYLSACEGTMTGPREQLVRHDFLGLADAIVQAGVPAVLGFRWPVSDHAALEMCQAFYRSLAQHGEPDVALLDARRNVYRENADDPAWLSPILIVQG